MLIKSLSQREKRILLFTIMLVVVVFFYNFLIEPVLFHVKSLDNRIQSKMGILAKNARLLRLHNSHKKEYIKYVELIENTGDEERVLAKVLGEIEDISKKNNFNIANIKTLTTKQTGNYKEISFEVIADGTIEEISKFLYLVESSEKNLRVKRFSITPKSSTKGNLRGVFLITKLILE